jgi:starch-binding outer membrane protein, SusD/RagB family
LGSNLKLLKKMKRRYIKYFVALFTGAAMLAACSQDFLEVKPKGTDLEDNYYRNADEAFNGLVAIYDVVGWLSGAYITKFGTANVASDDLYAGGGHATDINEYQVMNKYTLTPETGPQEPLWAGGFSGVFRSNVLISKLPGVPMDENLKARYMAEARFLRAYFYFDLVRFFRNVPLFKEPLSAGVMYEVTQEDPNAVLNFIEEELVAAIEHLPANVDVARWGGRATKPAAKALLGKVYLWRNKYAEAAAQLKDVNGTPGGTSQYGNKLLANYADLWVFTNKHNAESIFERNHTGSSAWGDWGCIGCSEGNFMNILAGPRNYEALSADAPKYVSGWSFFTVTEKLFDAMEGDPRRDHTIANLKKLVAEGKAKYNPHHDDTGYFLKKILPQDHDRPTGGGAEAGNFAQNIYEIRLADTYLLEAEALVRGNQDPNRAKDLVNAVRARVGLAPLSTVTFDNIIHERRMELAGEGHRWFDLIRWGKAPEVLAWTGFQAGKHEVLPIPYLELQNTKIEQNKEYGGTK